MASNIKDNEELNDFLLVRSANEVEEVIYDVETFGGISDDNTGPGDDSQTIVLLRLIMFCSFILIQLR